MDLSFQLHTESADFDKWQYQEYVILQVSMTFVTETYFQVACFVPY